jgi:hypothetical protein
MSDQPPQWGEPGYVPPPKPPVTLRPWQRRALGFALVLAVLGQLLYWTGLLWGPADCYQVFGHPGVAIAGFVISVAAIAPDVPVLRLWFKARLSFALPTSDLVVAILVLLGPPFEILLMLGGGCWWGSSSTAGRLTASAQGRSWQRLSVGAG